MFLGVSQETRHSLLLEAKISQAEFTAHMQLHISLLPVTMATKNINIAIFILKYSIYCCLKIICISIRVKNFP